MVKRPNCPAGYTWLYQLGQACFKVTSSVAQFIGSNFFQADHPVANSMCAQDNTRLAVAENLVESTALLAWLRKPYFGVMVFFKLYHIKK